MIASINHTLAERGKRYGTFSGNATTSQRIKAAIFNGHQALSHDQREALEMIAHKIARIMNGDPSYIDSWVDIAGYATLVAERLGGDAI